MPPSSVLRKLATYGFGQGPAYLSGELEWHSGETATLYVEPGYSGTLVVRWGRLDGGGSISLATEDDLPPQARTGVMNATTRPDGVELQTTAPGYGSIWFGRLTTGGPGCFGLQVDGATFTELIVFAVQPGGPPPG
jgi:hypothetical protein